ncbi:alpha/beta-hydrolase [Violaceomyces palustris]|uniref:Alpha/beta-hydrolase n=1 Tax=Violaceomyces palustris TaxID=1673888 RepID=A0ACD0NUM6_9BASI|nr:alpha/beta-hydrolase [Violaceomyces palustris]
MLTGTNPPNDPHFPSFERHSVKLPGRGRFCPELEIFTLRYRPPPPLPGQVGAGGGGGSSKVRPLLLIHGHPQTHMIWSKLAKRLVSEVVQEDGDQEWEIIIPDTRGMGQSSCPDGLIVLGDGDRDQEMGSVYGKREIGSDLVLLMEHFGHDRGLYIVGHDRGGRILHRLLLDWPERVERGIILDIAPTLDMYKLTDQNFSRLYWHWFFLIQKEPFPEEMISSNPRLYLSKLMGLSSLDPNSAKVEGGQEAYQSYLSQCSDYRRVSAMCEDYRSSAPGGVDLTRDQSDIDHGRLIQTPVRLLWGRKGVIQLLYQGGLDLWRNLCRDPLSIDRGSKALDCGHYVPEEADAQLAAEIRDFFT